MDIMGLFIWCLGLFIFVEHIQVIDSAKKGAVLHGFAEKPELSLETNWNVSKKLVVGSKHQKGFSLWLNKGSRIQVRCEVPVGNSSDFLVVLSKDNGEEEYIIEEDDMYSIHLLNMNPRSIIGTSEQSTEVERLRLQFTEMEVEPNACHDTLTQAIVELQSKLRAAENAKEVADADREKYRDYSMLHKEKIIVKQNQIDELAPTNY
ncbi:hypothetical protein NE237_010667 [Protea cynaroides]|uniref:E3 ubiquitin-protein ligase APD1-4 N-terminal domain-containing protein n=1 Tax=Protea cynaroides TaxID=273540 RepID=A0A9Q0R1U5_9MAGN|nr:hypothetical protein NE237_010667 [Protea cynaroides]